MTLVGGYHFVTGQFTSHKSFLPDDEYARGLDNFVKGCSDMLITNSKGQILTGKRSVHPQPDWWYVGGRMMPGESPASRPITYNSLAWDMREQEPKSNGTCDVNIVLTVELTDEEISSIVLDPKEYVASKWIELDELLEGAYHPALQYSARSLLVHKTMCALKAAVSEGKGDGEVAALSRQLVSLSADPPCGTASYVVKSDLHPGYAAAVNTFKA